MRTLAVAETLNRPKGFSLKRFKGSAIWMTKMKGTLQSLAIHKQASNFKNSDQ